MRRSFKESDQVTFENDYWRQIFQMLSGLGLYTHIK